MRATLAAVLSLLSMSLLPGACATYRPSASSDPARPDRRHAILVGASFAGTNNPQRGTASEDNTALSAAARLCVGPLSLRPELHAGDLSVQFTPAVTYDFALAGRGDGAIDGHVGLGYSFLSERENNVLGDTASPFARAGVEGYLVGGVMVGAALLVAPWGYEHDDIAVAGIAYTGLRF